jgi:hypothetical protein
LKTLNPSGPIVLKLPGLSVNGMLGGGALKLPGGEAPNGRVCIAGFIEVGGIVIGGGSDGGVDGEVIAARSGNELGIN